MALRAEPEAFSTIGGANPQSAAATVEIPDAELDSLLDLAAKSAPKPLARIPHGRHEKASTKVDPAALDKAAAELEQLFPVKDSTALDKFTAGAARGVASLAKAPELVGKAAEALGVKKGTVERHLPFIKGLADAGRDLEGRADALDDPRFAEHDFGSELMRGAGSMVPLAFTGGVAGLAGKAAGTAAIALTGAAMGAVPMYEDVLAETGDETKAWQAAALGAGLGASDAFGAGKVLAKLNRVGAGSLYKALVRAAAEGGEEAFQELTQTVGESVGRKALTDKEIDLLDELVQGGRAGALGAVLGAGLSGVQGVVSAPFEARAERAQKARMEGTLGRMDARARARGAPTDTGGPVEVDLGGRTVADVSEEARAPVKATEVMQPAPAEGQASPLVADAVPERPAPEAQAEADDAAKRIVAGEDVELEELTPEVIQRVLEQSTPAPQGPAQGAEGAAKASPDATSRVAPEPAAATRGAGVSPSANSYVTSEEDARGSSLQPGDTVSEIRHVPIKEPKKTAGYKPEEAKVLALMEAMRRKEPLPAILVSDGPAGPMTIDDGGHRHEAARRLGFKTIPVRVVNEKPSEVAEILARAKPEPAAPKKRTADVVGSMRAIVEQFERGGADDPDSLELTDVLDQARRVAESRKGGATSELDDALESLLLAANTKPDPFSGSREETARTDLMLAEIKHAKALLGAFDKTRAEYAGPERRGRTESPESAEGAQRSRASAPERGSSEAAPAPNPSEAPKSSTEPRPLSAAALRDAFDLDEEQAAATEALVEAMGLDKKRIQVVRGGTPGKGALRQAAPGRWYFSNIAAALERWQPKGTAEQLKAFLGKTKGASEEAAWIGLDKWLEGKERVTRADVLAFVEERTVTVEETKLSGAGASVQMYSERSEEADVTPEENAEWMEDDPRRWTIYRSYLAGEEYYDAKSTDGGDTWSITLDGRELDHDIGDPMAAIAEYAGVDLEGAGGEARYADWQTPGGEGYTELLLRLPVKIGPGSTISSAETYSGPHFAESNILAHVRFNEREDEQGRVILFIEEIQSDWHQAGKKRGYVDPVVAEAIKREQAEVSRLQNESDKLLSRRNASVSAADHQAINARLRVLNALDVAARLRIAEMRKGDKGDAVADAPFKKSWPRLALKRMLAYAADKGFDGIAWTSGAMQAERYNLEHVVKEIVWGVDRGTRWVSILPQEDQGFDLILDEQGVVTGSPSRNGQPFVDKQLAEIVGREIAARVMAEPEGKIAGDGLKIGGEAMEAFYDRELVTTANDIGKKLGLRVGTTTFDAADDMESFSRGPIESVPFIELPKATREKIKAEGFPLFQGDKGATEFTEAGEALIRALEAPDVSTGLHEIAHVARRFLLDRSVPEGQRAGITDHDIKVAEEWAGATDGAWSVDAEEKFARGFERYLFDGRAPNLGLRNLFEKVSAWLKKVYVKLAGSAIDLDISEAMRAVYDRLVTRAEQLRAAAKKDEAPKKRVPLDKAAEEDVEAHSVKLARALIRGARKDGALDTEVFDTLLAGYKNQPRLAARTSTSRELQAYSTPLPLAWVASRLAGIGPGVTVYEPTAGNGALLIDADADLTHANELDPKRAAALRALGFEATSEDASAFDPAGSGDLERVIANPPFGKAKTDSGSFREWPIALGGLAWRTREIDHAIAVKALAAMTDHGKAVLLVAGKKPFGDSSEEARTQAYRTLEDQRFWKALYGTYNVKDHFTVEGKLYDRMGAAWPIDVVVIDGRGDSPAKMRPYAQAPRVLSTWDEVRALLPGEKLEAGRDVEPSRKPKAPKAAPVQELTTEQGLQMIDEAEGRTAPAPAARPAPRAKPAPTEATEAPAPRAMERVGEFQATNRPRSKRRSVDTLLPANMQAAMDRALGEIEREHGPVDRYVEQKLGYTAAEADEFFSAEQVDALALAIKNLDDGAGFIVGDQTGVGKGRIVAGVLRYAQRIGKIPVFVTAKPGLYADMRRDLADIGMKDYRAFITNTTLRGEKTIVLEDGEKLAGPTKAEADATWQKIVAAKALPDGTDAIFTTYDQQNPLAGEFAARSQALKAIAPNAVFVMDESHLAGGTEARPVGKDAQGNAVLKATRSDLFREIVDLAHGVVYSSATYAKNPYVMTLYTRTGLGLAADRAKLPALVQRGGVPLQQIIASMLVRAGQYVRREKSYEGIAMDLDVAETNRAPAERATALIRALFDFDLRMEGVREDFRDAQGGKGAGHGAGDTGVGSGGGKSGGFSSVLHNVISQMLLSLKAREVGRRAVATFHEGKKPIVALSNTLEGLLAEQVAELDLEKGDTIEGFTFGKVFERYLERMRWVPIKKLDGVKAERVRIPDEEMGGLLGDFEALKELIAATDLGDMPASPIDAIIAEMEAGGMKVGEITGRELRVAYDADGNATVTERKSADAFKKKAMREFNNGQLDALVINQSGSTGYSLHASPKNGKDVRPRHMFVVQADANIDVFMQMLGRINRTGQTSLPGYTVLVSDLPSEKRPAAILMRKMASLNANTSASRKSAVSLKSVVDFMNQYGDEAVNDVLAAEPELAESIGLSDEKIETALKNDDLARKATGLFPLLTIEQQEQLLEQIEANYLSRLEEARAKGENLLEAEVHDLRATVLSETTLVPGDGRSPFTEPAKIQQVEVTRSTKPLTWEAIQARSTKMGGDVAALERQVDDALGAVKAKFRAQYEAVKKEGESEEITKRLKAIEGRFARIHGGAEAIKDRIRLLTNRAVVLESSDDSTDAYLVGIEAPTKGNPLAPSNWSLVLAAVDGEGMLKIPVSRLMAKARGEPGFVAVEKARHEIGERDFQAKASERREKRWMVTGNLLAGFQKLDGKGQIVFYTDDKGHQHQGILLKRGQNPQRELEAQPVRMTPAQALEFLDAHGGFVEDSDGIIRIATRGRGSPLHIVVSNKGGKPYYLHKGARAALGKDFDSRRGKKDWEVYTDDRAAVQKALDLYAEDLGMLLEAKQNKGEARKITGEKVPDLSSGTPAPDTGPTDVMEAMAFPGSILPDVRDALDWTAKKLGYVRAQRAFVAGAVPTEQFTEHQIRKWQDSFRGVKTTQAIAAHLEQEVAESFGVQLGEGLPEEFDTYLDEELRRGKTGTRMKGWRDQHHRPLLAGLRKEGISPEEFGEALMARHAPERNAAIVARDPKNKAGSGMTDEAAQAIMDKVEGGKRAEGFARAFARYDAMMADVRAGWVRDGLKSQDEVDQLEELYSYYAPLRSDLDDESDAAPVGTGRGLDIRGREFKTALGRKSRADARNVLAYAFTQAEQAIIRGEKNRVGQTFLAFVREYGDMLTGFAKVQPKQVKRALVGGFVKTVYDPLFKLGDNVLAVKENGDTVLIEIDRRYQNVADGLKNLGAENAGKVVTLAGKVTRAIAALATRYNPPFWLLNSIFKDIPAAFLHSLEHGVSFAARVVRDIPLAFVAMHRSDKGGGKWATHLREYREAGGPISFLDLKSFEQQIRDIEAEARSQASRGAIGKARRSWGAVRDLLGREADVFENMARFSSYVNAREHLGMSAKRAASFAKNLTVNFERKGDHGRMLGAWYAFANAGIQGTARVGQAVKHPAVRKMLVGAFIYSMIHDQLQRALGGEDDDGEDRWDKIPSYIKRHNLIFFLPDGSGRHVTIPLPFVYDWIQTAGQQLSGAMSGDVKIGEALGETMAAAMEAFDPIGVSRVDLSDPGSIARAITPTGGKWLTELATNRDWKGDLVGPTDYGDGKPDSERFWPEKASSESVAVARWLNSATGGDKFEPGMIDVSPHTLDHLAAFLTGGLGRTLAQVANVGEKMSRGEELELRDLPVASRLARDPSPFVSAGEFHDLQGVIRVERERAKAEKKLLRPELGRLWREGNQLEERRQRQRKEIEKLTGDARRRAERELDRALQLWNRKARTALLTE